MGLSVYIHIPYCLQRCRYCDFTTFEAHQIMPPAEYLQLLMAEIRQRHSFVRQKEIDTIYFGGGTPSLFPAEMIVAILTELANVGFVIRPNAEITMEINPATLDPKKVEVCVAGGINRYSVGAQTFNDPLLKSCGRLHSAQDTRETLKLLRSYDLNYSFDLLFALPGQTLTDLSRDLEEVSQFDPPHLSAYCLTVPQGHPMATGRPPEDEQIAMFEMIEGSLLTHNLRKYEISNFAKPGLESRHNMAYWNDREYWGLGLSAHSYLHNHSFGTRFWNPKGFAEYEQQVHAPALTQYEAPADFLPESQKEPLLEHESISDFCHIFLRTMFGLDLRAVRNKFSASVADLIDHQLLPLTERGLVAKQGPVWRLTPQGQLLSNHVFEFLSFSQEDIVRWRAKPIRALREHPILP